MTLIFYSYSLLFFFVIIMALLISVIRLVKSIKTYTKNKESVIFAIPKRYNPLALVVLANFIFGASVIFVLNNDRSLITDIVSIIFILIGFTGFNELIMVPYFIKEGLVVNGILFTWKELSIKDVYNQKITIRITKRLFSPKRITLNLKNEDLVKLQEKLKK